MQEMQVPATGEGKVFQYSCLKNPVDLGAWWAILHGAQSWTRTYVYVNI